MKDEEQAKRICDAIDALLRGEEPEMELDDQEFIELLRIARLRHQAGQALADVGLTYQELLRRVLQARMVARQMEESGDKVKEEDAPLEVTGIMDEDPASFLDPLEPGYGKLINFLDFQPRLARTAVAASTTTHQTQPKPHTPTRHWGRHSDRTSEKVEVLSSALDQLVSGRKRNISAGDPDIDELIQVAQLRRFVGQSLAAAGSPYKRRLWTFLRVRLATSLRRQSYAAQRPSLIAAVGRLSWQRAAAAAAAVALLLAALGPLPATGFAGHPISHLLSFVEQRVGVQEVDGPPPNEVPTSVPGQSMLPEQAQSLMALPLKEPSYLPDGFELASSLYYAESMTSPEQGTYVLMYTIGGVEPETVAGTEAPRLSIYQERTSSDTMAVMNGQAEDVLIGDSLPGSYARFLWVPGEQGALEGADASAESLFFDNDGVRVTITYRNGGQEKENLLRIAESMLS
jgi:hypothetical protein